MSWNTTNWRDANKLFGLTSREVTSFIQSGIMAAARTVNDDRDIPLPEALKLVTTFARAYGSAALDKDVAEDFATDPGNQ